MRTAVYVEECQGYDLARIRKFVYDTVVAIEQTAPLFYRGQKVFIKLNLLTERTPDQFTTTNPLFVQAIIQVLKDRGCDIIIGDSPAGEFTPERLRKIYAITGFARVAEQEKIRLNYDCSIVKMNGIQQVKAMHDADIVVNACKLKTHTYTAFTGAVKNCFGSVPGEEKHRQHALHPLLKGFCTYLIKVCQTLDPAISFMDGITAMQGNGPSNGDRYEAGLMLASRNPYALDHIALRLLQIPTDLVYTDTLARDLGLFEHIDFCSSANIGHFIKYDFALPDRITKAAAQHELNYPFFDHSLCIGCQNCVRSCPQKTIVMTEGKASVDTANCIKCYCCQEICPVNAIKIT